MKNSALFFFITIITCIDSIGMCADNTIIKTENETIVGRASGLVLESQNPTTIILNFDPSRFDTSQANDVLKVCRSVAHVKSAKYNAQNNTVEITVPPFGGSFESVGNEITKKLEDALGVRVLECRIRT